MDSITAGPPEASHRTKAAPTTIGTDANGQSVTTTTTYHSSPDSCYDRPFLLRIQRRIPKNQTLVVRNPYNGFVQPVQYSLISGRSHLAQESAARSARLSAAESSPPSSGSPNSSRPNTRPNSKMSAHDVGGTMSSQAAASLQSQTMTTSTSTGPTTNSAPAKLQAPQSPSLSQHHQPSQPSLPLSPKIIGRKGRTPKPPDLEITLTMLEDRRGVTRKTFLDQNGMVVDDAQGVFSDIFDAQKPNVTAVKLWKSSISKNGALLDVWRDQDGNVFHDAGGSLDMIFESVRQVNSAARKKAARQGHSAPYGPVNTQQYHQTMGVSMGYNLGGGGGPGAAGTSPEGLYPASGASHSTQHSLSGVTPSNRHPGRVPPIDGPNTPPPGSMSSYPGYDNSSVSLKTAPNAPTPPVMLGQQTSQQHLPQAAPPGTPPGMDASPGVFMPPDAAAMGMYYDPYLNAYVMPQPIQTGFPGQHFAGGFPALPMSDLSYSGTPYAVPPPSEISNRAARHNLGSAPLTAFSQRRGKSEQSGPETMNQRRGSLYKALTAMKQSQGGRGGGETHGTRGQGNNTEGHTQTGGQEPNTTSSSGSRGGVKSSPKFRRRRDQLLPGQEAPDPETQAKISKMHKEAYERAIENCEGEGCTMMLKNIPNKYTREMLVRRLEEDFKTLINFLYMPIDFVTECNVGYCFINFRTENAANAFKQTYNQWHTKKVLPGYNSNKIAEVSAAAVQGLYLNLERLKRSPLLPMLKANEAWQPVLFDKEGKMFPFPCETDKHWARRPGDEPVTKKTASGSSANARSSPVSPPPGISPPASAAQQGLSYYDQEGGYPISEANYAEANYADYVLVADPGFYDPHNQQNAYEQPVGTLTLKQNGNNPLSPSIISPQISSSFQPSPVERMESGQSPLSRTVSNVSGVAGAPTTEYFKKAELSPKQQKLSDDMKIQVTRAQIEHYFTTTVSGSGEDQGNGSKPTGPGSDQVPGSERTPAEKEIDDRGLLRRAMDGEGWIPITALMSLKGMYYPGHDLMRDCIRQSKVLEMNEGRDKFRCADSTARQDFLTRFEGLCSNRHQLLKSKN
eukprot:CAMPEP_0178999326 /NCGR_PEP_ID=MMETSP0795-20121207/9989_1 /TAXON_ID=88552 /ORGANISM="Amoebophrya sp., Strain Ameob2" /LENGTH=1072 /DNA_ID=CAMNT_0020692069 /DNA_START=765 /DNA_END=3983 /DNA_ORIENTATION=-